MTTQTPQGALETALKRSIDLLQQRCQKSDGTPVFTLTAIANGLGLRSQNLHATITGTRFIPDRVVPAVEAFISIVSNPQGDAKPDGATWFHDRVTAEMRAVDGQNLRTSCEPATMTAGGESFIQVREALLPLIRQDLAVGIEPERSHRFLALEGAKGAFQTAASTPEEVADVEVRYSLALAKLGQFGRAANSIATAIKLISKLPAEQRDRRYLSANGSSIYYYYKAGRTDEALEARTRVYGRLADGQWATPPSQLHIRRTILNIMAINIATAAVEDADKACVDALRLLMPITDIRTHAGSRLDFQTELEQDEDLRGICGLSETRALLDREIGIQIAPPRRTATAPARGPSLIAVVAAAAIAVFFAAIAHGDLVAPSAWATRDWIETVPLLAGQGMETPAERANAGWAESVLDGGQGMEDKVAAARHEPTRLVSGQGMEVV